MTTTRHTTTVVVGAGHSGLAVSSHLTARGIDHVVLERGRVGNSWHTQRWDSLRLLTPNWMTRLPGTHYRRGAPDAYMSARRFGAFVGDYAQRIEAPVQLATDVLDVRPDEHGFRIETSQGPWRSASVVLASGSVRGAVPALAAALPVPSIHAIDYKNPSGLPEGGVLVVGAGASGIQIAAELQASGRPVTLAVGEHVRAPRRYRGRDIFSWIDEIGLLDERWDEVEDVVRARRLPSFQLVGADRTLDLNALQDLGVRIVGKLAGVRDDELLFSGSLANVAALADLKLARLLTSIDAVAGGQGERLEPTRIPPSLLTLSLPASGIRSVVWATGIKPDHSFVSAPVFDAKGAVQHVGGVTAIPRLYVVGLPVLRRRRSTYIDGAAGDAAAIVEHLADALRITSRARDETRVTVTVVK